MNDSIGTWLIILGGVLLVIGIIAKLGIFGWFGHLPGDIHVKRENFQFYFPLASMIVVSIVLTLVINLVRRFF